MARRAALTIAAVLGVAASAMGVTAATAQPSAADQPPECVNIVVQAAQPGGTMARLHLDFCGNGGGADSALHDYVNHDRTFALSGGGAIGTDCGSWSAPCVIIGP